MNQSNLETSEINEHLQSDRITDTSVRREVSELRHPSRGGPALEQRKDKEGLASARLSGFAGAFYCESIDFVLISSEVLQNGQSALCASIPKAAFAAQNKQ